MGAIVQLERGNRDGCGLRQPKLQRLFAGGQVLEGDRGVLVALEPALGGQARAAIGGLASPELAVDIEFVVGRPVGADRLPLGRGEVQGARIRGEPQAYAGRARRHPAGEGVEKGQVAKRKPHRLHRARASAQVHMAFEQVVQSLQIDRLHGRLQGALFKTRPDRQNKGRLAKLGAC
jgi:hypothetical protein